MTELALFAYEGHQVRTVTLDGEPWFIAADVCAALEIAEARSSLRLLDDDEKGVHSVPTLGGDQQVSVINEPGLYSLILRSRKPEAKAFKRWITHEVLPAIRKTGRYEVAARHEIPQTLAEALRLAADHLDRAEAAEVKVAEQGRELEIQAPKVAFVDTFVAPDRDATILRVLAKQLGVQEKALRLYLRNRKIVYRRVVGTRWSNSQCKPVTEYQWLPHAGYESWFVLRDQPDVQRDHNGQLRTTLYVTPAGKVGIQKLIARAPIAQIEQSQDGVA